MLMLIASSVYGAPSPGKTTPIWIGVLPKTCNKNHKNVSRNVYFMTMFDDDRFALARPKANMLLLTGRLCMLLCIVQHYNLYTIVHILGYQLLKK